MAVTRPLEHSIPSQPSQGSEPTQLGGVFSQSFFRAERAVTASETKKDIFQSLNLNTKIVAV